MSNLISFEKHLNVEMLLILMWIQLQKIFEEALIEYNQ